jgi:hypothetical protein
MRSLSGWEEVGAVRTVDTAGSGDGNARRSAAGSIAFLPALLMDTSP